MTEDDRPKQILNLEAGVPEKHFAKWMQMQFDISRIKILCELVKDSLPYFTVIILFLLTLIFCPQALIAVIPGIVAYLIKVAKKG